MFAAWGRGVARFRWPVFAVTLAAVVAAGVWGLGVFGQLTEGGYNDPGSESTRAAEVVGEALGAQGGDVVVIYTPTGGAIDDAVLAQRVENRLSALPRDAVTASTSYWETKAPQYVSADRRSAVAVLTLAGNGDAEKLESYREITDRLDVAGASTQLAGAAALSDASATRSTRDLAIAEAISLPIVLILLLLIFGSLVAAALPVIVGGAAVLGSLGVLHAVASGHDVNSFAVNVASLLGLGMAIDYGLFMVGRFREEQSYGRTPTEAVIRTVATAGRTVLFSATLLMIALAGLLLFPQGFLKSLAYGGLAAVALAALLSLTLLPALLAILGPRVDKLPIRLPRRRSGRPAGTGWAALADVVLRRPVLIALPIIAGLLVLAAPIRGVQFGEADERVLPAAEPARQAIETLKADFPALSSSGIQVVLRGGAAGAEAFAAALAEVPGVAEVTPAGAADDVTVFTATPRDGDPFGEPARETVRDIRALKPPAGAELLVGGTTARNVDSLEATADRLPLMIVLLAGATLLLMFLAFGSVLLPVKAVVMSALSLAATFGILVWIFQDGHGAGLLDITPAPPEVGIVVLMAAVVFGLSTDYEVFLLSRMVEARTRGATTAEAVTTGLARTGRVISAAALLLIVVTGAFALSSITTMRFVGVGMIIALVLDATVVRMLLVPAVLGLMGDAAWWAPGPLRRLQEKAGLAEYEDEELFPTVSVGRHAAPEEAVARSASAARPRHASADEPAATPAWAEPAREFPAAVPAGSGTALPGSPAAVPSTAALSASTPAAPAPEPSAGVAPAAAVASAPVPPAAEGGQASEVAPTSPAAGAAPVSPATPGGSAPTTTPTSPAPVTASASVPVSAAGPDPAAAGVPTGERATVRAPGGEQTAIRAATGQQAEIRSTSGEQAAVPAADGEQAAVRAPSGEQATVRVPTGEQPALPTPSGEQPPVRIPAGDDTAVPAPGGEQTAVRTPSGEQPPVRISGGDDTAVRAPSGEQTAVRAPSAEQQAVRAAGTPPAALRTPTGEQAAAPSPNAARLPSGEQATVRTPSGEPPAVRTPTGEQAAARKSSGEQPALRTPSGEQTAVRSPSGEQNPVAGNHPASGTPAPATPVRTTPAAGDEPAAESHPTVNLADRVTDPDDPEPDATAVLELRPTVDLSSRRHPKSRRPE